MGRPNEKKKRNKVRERDTLEDGHLGNLDLDFSKMKKKKTKHDSDEEVSLGLPENYVEGKQIDCRSELDFSNNLCENTKVKKLKKKRFAIDLVENTSKSENQSNIDLQILNRPTTTSVLVENNELTLAQEQCSDLMQQRKKKKKKKHAENSISSELETNTTELPEPPCSTKKKKKRKSSAIDSDINIVDGISSNKDCSNGLLSENSIMDEGKISKANIPEQNIGEKFLPEQDQCDKLLVYFKDDLSPSKSENNNQFNSDSNNIKLGSLLQPTYLKNKNVENSNQFIKQNSDRSFNEAKLLKKEEQKSRYPEVQNDTVELSEGRHYTISIAIPASILEETCLLHELRTYVIGQLARAACIFSVDEIIVYNDQCWRSSSELQECIGNYIGMMKMILEYQECPQYLRRDLFPRHPCMSKVGVLNALNAPHHLLSNQWCTYREGIVIDRNQGKVSFVDVGLRNDVQIDRKLEPGLRVTVKFPPEVKGLKKLYGSVVSPHEPRIKGGLYWGYTVRVADSLPEVFKSDDFQDGYDLIIGTSDKGDNIFDTELDSFEHALIVFGGVDGLEIAMEADSSIKEKNPRNLFQYYLNCCPNQQSRTIRTEEAVFVTLSSLSQKLKQYGSRKSS